MKGRHKSLTAAAEVLHEDLPRKMKISQVQRADILSKTCADESGDDSCLELEGPPLSPSPALSMAAMSGFGTVGDAGGLQLAALAQNKRKEKARIAARARRSQEASIIMEIAGELQISQDKLRRIDKATIVKLAIDYMKAVGVLCHCQKPENLLYALATKTTTTTTTTQLQGSSSDNSNTTTSSVISSSSDIDIEERENNRRQELQQQRPAAVARPEKIASNDEQTIDDNKQQEPPLFSAPKLATASIFAPKTLDNMNSHFLMIEENQDNGKASFVLKPDTEILDDDDLTHLAPQAGDISISLEVEPLDGIPSDDLLMLSPKSSVQTISVFFNSCKAA